MGAVHPIVADPVVAAATVIVNAGKVAVFVPSLTEIETLAYVPTAPDAGVPVRRPVAELKVAQVGMFEIEKVSVPDPPLAEGWNEYVFPTVAVVDGVPLMLGGVAAATTVRLAAADLLGSSAETAVTVTVAGDGALAGAV